MTKLNPQASYILNILSDRQWHCPIEWDYADGHCKRITDINNHLKEKGLRVEAKVCDCGRHASKVFKRRLTDEIEQPTSDNPIVLDFLTKHPSKVFIKKEVPHGMMNF